MPHNKQKKIAVIGDFCGFGRCSLAVSLPIVSALGFQCCPVPTSVFSDHTGFDSFLRIDLTRRLKAYLHEWEKLGLRFDGVLSGYLASTAQVELVHAFLETFPKKGGVKVVDPVMGDNGALYASMPKSMVSEMKTLLPLADCVTPNLTEACLLTGVPYRADPDNAALEELCARLAAMGPKTVVISGVDRGKWFSNFVYEKKSGMTEVSEPKTGPCRSGTGDVFSAILTSDLVAGLSAADACRHAAAFIVKALRRTTELDLPATDGIAFEEFLREI